MLTVREAAKLICVEQVTIRHYITLGVGKNKEKLKAIKIKHGLRKEYRIKGEDLQKFKEKFLTINNE